MKGIGKINPRLCAEIGIFTLGCYEIENSALRWIRRQKRSETGVLNNDIIIYGAGIEAVTVLGKLLEYGVESSRIICVVPDTQHVFDTSTNLNLKNVIGTLPA